MTGKILITGATGSVGAALVKRLQQMNTSIRVAGSNVETLHARFGDSVDAVAFDFLNNATFASTFEGVDKMFLMRPPQIANVQRDIFPALDTARAAGVQRVVFLSLIGIERAKIVPHYKIEQYLVASGLDYTFLRCSFFMQNLNTTHRAEIKERSEIYVPAGSSRTSFIDVRDIAAVAARALTEPGRTHKAYDLTGGEALDYWQAAEIISKELGRRITYRNPNPLAFLVNHVRRGAPIMVALVMTGLYLSTRFGMADIVTQDVEHVTGHTPLTFAQYVHDYREAWL